MVNKTPMLNLVAQSEDEVGVAAKIAASCIVFKEYSQQMISLAELSCDTENSASGISGDAVDILLEAMDLALQGMKQALTAAQLALYPQGIN